MIGPFVELLVSELEGTGLLVLVEVADCAGDSAAEMGEGEPPRSKKCMDKN